VATVLARETFFGRMSRSEMEVLYEESAIFGASLRMPPDMWLVTLEDFWGYSNHNIATLEVTDVARKMSSGLLYPKNLPLWMKLVSPFTWAMTNNWLPE
jgi:uncharacterized protein (DUF2236 family)